MTQQYAYFSELPVKTVYRRNGDTYCKVSQYRATTGTCVFNHLDCLCIVGEYCRLDKDYFAA